MSTDDEDIAEVARRSGVAVPFLRPPELAKDETPMLPVVQHALRWMEERAGRFDAVCLLQPTTPFRRAEEIDACIELLERSGASAVVTVLPVPADHHPHWVYFADGDGRLRLSTGLPEPVPRRQELPPAFHREGSVYVTRRDVVLHENSLYGSHLIGLPVDGSRSVNIDGLDEWARAEALL